MKCEDLVEEFNENYFNIEITEAQQDEFNNFRQGNLTVTEAVKKFDQLACLCPNLVTLERDKVKKMLKMFRSDPAVVINSGPYLPMIMANYVI